jgi:hypothetical protein
MRSPRTETHHPEPNMNLIELQAQTTVHGTTKTQQPVTTGFSTTPTMAFGPLFGSQPSSCASNISVPALGTGLNFGRGSRYAKGIESPRRS